MTALTSVNSRAHDQDIFKSRKVSLTRHPHKQRQLHGNLPKSFCHSLPQFRHRVASSRNSDKHPNMLVQLPEPILPGHPLVVVLPVPRLGSVVLKPLSNVGIKEFVNEFHDKPTPIFWSA